MSDTIRAAARTDVGRQRELNEDSVFIGGHVFVVADGLGGHKGGEVASAIAIDTIKPLADLTPSEAAAQINDAVQRANVAIFDRSRGDHTVTGMGTTVTAFVVDGAIGHLVHVGDSRAYLIRDGAIEQLSEDHSMVARMVREGRLTPEEAERHPQRSMLTRALGSERDVRLDDTDIPLAPGDRILLCSDGLTNMLSDAEIAATILDRIAPQEICDALIDQANERGGIDNITAALIELPASLVGAPLPTTRSIGGTNDAAAPRSARRALTWIGIVLIFALAITGGLRLWANSSWFVGETSGEVAVFRGLPMQLPLIRLRQVVDTTGIPVADLPEYLQGTVRDGIRASSRDDAQHIVTTQIAPNVVSTADPNPEPTASASPSITGSPTP